MAVCPKCNHQLKMTDLSQFCPKCDTNLMFFGFAERFYKEAKFAEMDIAAFRVWLAKVKAAFFGGKLQIVRLCAVLLPVAALLVPLGTVSVTLPLFDEEIQISALGVYNLVSKGIISTLPNFRQSELLGDLSLALSIALASFFLTALIAIGILVAQILCFINIKRANASLAALSALGLISCVTSYILASRIPDFGSIVSASPNIIGLLCQFVAFTVIFALNAVLIHKGIEVKYREGDLYRVEMLSRYKRKEITLDELPLPVFETEAEKAERELKIQNTAEKIAFARAGELKNE